MNASHRARRGRPIWALATLLFAWAAYRLLAWQNPFAPIAMPAEPIALAVSEPEIVRDPAPQPGLSESSAASALWTIAAADLAAQNPSLYSATSTNRTQIVRPEASVIHLALPADSPVFSTATRIGSSGEAAPARQIAPSAAERPQATLPASPTPFDRWTFDLWLFARQGGSSGVVAGAQPASYGATQGGAMLRYRLSRGPRRPTAYARITASPRSGPVVAQQDAALGLSARPFPRVPLAAYGEARVTRTGRNIALRPAAFVASEFPPLDLPFETRGRAYFQGGYVGGDFATAFADGQVTIDRVIADTGLGSLRLGGGAWAGAQRGAERVDVGPSARLKLDIADRPVTLQLDYRIKVAGSAEPGSGVALTLASGL